MTTDTAEAYGQGAYGAGPFGAQPTSLVIVTFPDDQSAAQFAASLQALAPGAQVFTASGFTTTT